MKRIPLAERPDWREKAEEVGFSFHTMYGEAYWTEDVAYQFTMDQIENDIEDPSTELYDMCREAVARVSASEELMGKLAIPEAMRDYVAQSWRNADPELYARFDLAYDGKNPAKMLEINADTPTSLFESTSFQWGWLEDQIEAGVLMAGDDQFNRGFEALTERFAELFPQGTDIHFASVEGSDEDYGTVETMAWAAREAGMGAHYTTIASIGLTNEGQFADSQSRVIGTLFKLYPWEDMLRDDFALNIRDSGTQFLEPAWKAMLSNKGILPVLWEMFEGHPNLLPAFFAEDMVSTHPVFQRAEAALLRGSVRKPIFSREGSSVTITEGGALLEASPDTTYAHHPMIVQEYHPIPEFGGFRPIIGAWVVGRTCVGMGIREDRSRITQDLSHFVPHFIRN